MMNKPHETSVSIKMRVLNGFTLIELVLAIAILSIIGMSMLQVFAQSELIQTKACRLTDGSYYGQSLMEGVLYDTKNMTFDQVRATFQASPYSFSQTPIHTNTAYSYEKSDGDFLVSMTLTRVGISDLCPRIIIEIYHKTKADAPLTTLETTLLCDAQP